MPPGNLQPNLPQQSQQTSGQQPVGQANTNQQQMTNRRSLTLTREQMMEAQEMFATANKVTRPEKALILGFMAGSRENPCPHLGKLETQWFFIMLMYILLNFICIPFGKTQW